MNFVRLKFVVVVMIMTVFFFGERALAQYDEAQIKFVADKLKEKNLLSNLIDLTRADSRQSATRADLLFACYLIVRYLDDNSDLAGLNQKMTLLQASVKNLEKGGGRTSSEEVLVQRVLERVEKSLPRAQTPVSADITNEINEVRSSIESLKNSLKATPPQKYEKLEKKVHNNTVIASAAVVLSLVITIFAAR